MDWITIDTDLELQDIANRVGGITFWVIPEDTPATLRVMSYNVSEYETKVKFDHRLQNMLDHIRDANPDVICFQNLQVNCCLGDSFFQKLFTFTNNPRANPDKKGKSMYADLRSALRESYPFQ
jgi:hypothetical protein